jgi:hypothetical protein
MSQPQGPVVRRIEVWAATAQMVYNVLLSNRIGEMSALRGEFS